MNIFLITKSFHLTTPFSQRLSISWWGVLIAVSNKFLCQVITGPGQMSQGYILCQHNFEHNVSLKTLSIMLYSITGSLSRYILDINQWKVASKWSDHYQLICWHGDRCVSIKLLVVGYSSHVNLIQNEVQILSWAQSEHNTSTKGSGV